MIPYLEKKYEKKIPIEGITEKDIIYFCRDALSHSLTKENQNNNQKAIYEQEILSLIKLKDWDWFAKDIDRNIILTYPVYNNAFNIVQYLLENKKYNLQSYNEQCSSALQSCIMVTGEKMQQYLLSNDIHGEYITDMAFKAYTMSEYVMPNYKSVYIEKAQELIKLNTDFNKLVMSFLKYDEFEKIKHIFYTLIEEHPLPIQEKRKYIGNILNNLEEKKSTARFNSKYIDLKKWLNYHELNDKLIPKEIKISKRNKL